MWFPGFHQNSVIHAVGQVSSMGQIIKYEIMRGVFYLLCYVAVYVVV